MAKALLDDLILENDYHITTGNQTTKLLFETLSLLGQNEVAVKVLEKEDYPSFGYMFKCGATSIWERWENTTGIAMNSHNHPMHGAFSVWYFKALAGIRPCDEAVTGYITIKPDFVENLESAGADYRTAKGVVACSWKRAKGIFSSSVTVPWNSKAKLILPENAGFTVNGKRPSERSRSSPAAAIRSCCDAKLFKKIFLHIWTCIEIYDIIAENHTKERRNPKWENFL